MGFLLDLPKKFPKVSKCCCCCARLSLRTGVVIIAIIAIVLGGFYTYNTYNKFNVDYQGTTVTITGANGIEKRVYVPSLVTKDAAGPIGGVLGVMAALGLVGGSLGVMGVMMWKPTLVLGFFYTQLFQIVVSVIYLILTMASYRGLDCDAECTEHGRDEVEQCTTLCSTTQKTVTAVAVGLFISDAMLHLYYTAVIATYYRYLMGGPLSVHTFISRYAVRTEIYVLEHDAPGAQQQNQKLLLQPRERRVALPLQCL